MTTIQEIKLNMYLAVRNLVNANEGVTMVLPGFSENYAKFLGYIGQIQSIGEIQKTDRKGLALVKNKLKKSLTTIAGDYSRRLSAMAKFSGDTRLLSEISFSESEFRKMTDVSLKDYLKILHDRAEEKIELLANYGITPESQKTFMEQINSYNAILSTPRTAIAERSNATKKITQLFEAAEAALENMDLSVGIIKLSNPDFFDVYSVSRKLVETSSRRIMMKGTATELTSGNPMKAVLFVFKVAGSPVAAGINGSEITKKTSKKGIFYLKRIVPGTYKVMVSKPGYRSVELSVIISEKERNELHVELERA